MDLQIVLHNTLTKNQDVYRMADIVFPRLGTINSTLLWTCTDIKSQIMLKREILFDQFAKNQLLFTNTSMPATVVVKSFTFSFLNFCLFLYTLSFPFFLFFSCIFYISFFSSFFSLFFDSTH